MALRIMCDVNCSSAMVDLAELQDQDQYIAGAYSGYRRNGNRESAASITVDKRAFVFNLLYMIKEPQSFTL